MRRLLLLATALAGGLLTLPRPAPAQQGAIPDTIVTATRIPAPEARVPAAVTVISRQEIEQRGYQSLAEALTAVPGLRLAPTGGLGAQASAFLRGASSRSVLVLLDGVPINDPSEPNAAFNFGQDLLFDIERIEVLRGPASVLYGSGAIGGVVNLVTRRAPPDRAFAPFGELAGGTASTLRGGLGAAGTLGAFDYLLSGHGISTRGSDVTPRRIATWTGERDGFRGQAAAARLGWTPAPGARIEGMLRWRENVFGQDAANGLGTLADDPNAGTDDRRVFGQLRGEAALLDGLWTTGLRLFSTEDRRRYANPPDAANPVTELSRFRGTRTGLDFDNAVRLPALGPLDDGALGFGLTHALEQARSDGLFSDPLFGDTTSVVRAQQHTTAGWGTLQYRAFGRLDLTAALRHDAVTGFAGETTWRAGAVLALPEIATRARIAAGTAFAAPSLFQRFGVISFGFGTFRGNPDLKPERSFGWEIGTETDISAFGRPAFATAGWTFFQSRLRDLIAPDPSFTTNINIDRARIHGAELALTLRPAAWLEGSAAWTITEAFDASTGQRLPRRPEHVVSLTARIAPLPGVVLAPTLLVTGRAPDFVYGGDGNGPAGRTTPAGTVLNLAATWQALEKAALFLEARNLTNSRHEPVSGFVIPGPSVLIGTRFAL